MTEADLRRLVKQGAILSYEVLEADGEGNILEMSIRPYPPINKVWLGDILRRTYQRAKEAAWTGARAKN